MPARDAGPGRSRPRAVPNPLPPPNWHHVPADEVLQVLQVDLATGLDEPEVQRRRQEFGPNQVTARRGTPVWRRFLLQFHLPMVYILVLAAGVTGFLGEWVETSVSLGVVLVNAVVGFLPEAKAEHAIAALARLVAKARALREALVSSTAPSLTAAAAEQGISQSYATRLVRLAWLAPNSRCR